MPVLVITDRLLSGGADVAYAFFQRRYADDLFPILPENAGFILFDRLDGAVRKGNPANPNTMASSVRMCPRQKSSAACFGMPTATAASIASRRTVTQVAIVDSTTAGW
jgi:hypothetical protein